MFIKGVVFCAKCGKPVEKMTSQEDPFSGTVVFTVHCHGEKEQTILTHAELVHAISIDCSTAFHA